MITENEKKYGNKKMDIIEIQRKMSFEAFTGFIFGNIQKYLHRFTSESVKANNKEDIVKVLDYISRYEEYCKLDEIVNFDRLKELIDENDFKTAFIHSVDLEEFIIKLN